MRIGHAFFVERRQVSLKLAADELLRSSRRASSASFLACSVLVTKEISQGDVNEHQRMPGYDPTLVRA